MRELCQNNDIDFILLKAPNPYPHWYDEWDKQIIAYAEEHGLLYINTITVLDEIGIDFSTDTYDGGLHLNVWGAEKLSVYLGGVLTERGLGGVPSNAAWEEKAREYNAHKNLQLEEIEAHGKVLTLTREVKR
jgi:hypothetical protein